MPKNWPLTENVLPNLWSQYRMRATCKPLHRDINAANPCVIHTNVGDYVPAFVSYRDIHWLPNFHGFLPAALITQPRIVQLYNRHRFPLTIVPTRVRRPEVTEIRQRSPCGTTLSVTFGLIYRKRNRSQHIGQRPGADYS